MAIENNLYIIISFLLEKHNKTITQFAEYVGLDFDTIWEPSLFKHITVEQLCKISQFFNVTPDYLLNEHITQETIKEIKRQEEIRQREETRKNAVYDTVVVLANKDNAWDVVKKFINNINIAPVIAYTENLDECINTTREAINKGTNTMLYVPVCFSDLPDMLDKGIRKTGKIVNGVCYGM